MKARAFCILVVLAAPVFAQNAEILAVIQKSADDWNTGSLEAYVQCYERSPDTTFVGSAVTHGTAGILERYRRAYATPDSMGRLTFSELEPRILSPQIAVVTGRYTLERPPSAGGRKTGLFTVIMRKSDAGWRIIHDHSN